MEVMPIIESLFRWIHVIAGVLWIGLLYFFNWVNANVMPKLDGETRRLVPELMPRALTGSAGARLHVGDRLVRCCTSSTI
jgi:hypothetical protein